MILGVRELCVSPLCVRVSVCVRGHVVWYDEAGWIGWCGVVKLFGVWCVGLWCLWWCGGVVLHCVVW